MRRVLLLVSIAVGCKTAPTPVPTPAFRAEPIGQPEISGCPDTVDVALTAALIDAPAGSGRFEDDDGTVLWEGPLSPEVALTVSWDPARGPVRGRFVADGQAADIVFPVVVRPPEAPEITTIGLSDGADIVELAALDAAADTSPWTDAIAIDTFPSLAVAFSNPHADLGVEPTVTVELCPVEGPCQPLPATHDGATGLADLATRAAERCDDRDDTSRDLFVAHVQTACGDDTAQITPPRVVEDDCDDDGVLAAQDCDDEEPAVASIGDIAADGTLVPTLADALSASEVVLCGGTHPGGLLIDQSVTVRSVGGPATLAAPVAGSTLVIAGGAVVLDDLIVLGGDAGAGDGGAIDASGAVSLTLNDVVLDGGLATNGGNLAGPTTGLLTVQGGVWRGGQALAEGGNAHVSGGDLQDLRIEDGTAGSGGGLYADGPVQLVDVVVTGGMAGSGGGAFLEAPAILAGCELIGNTATGNGGALFAQLEVGQVLDLRPSIVDLSLTELRDNTAVEGGALFQSGGTLESVLAVIDTASAERGGGVYLSTAVWEDSGSAFIGTGADLGAIAFLDATSAVWVDASATSSTAISGGLYLTGGASVSLDQSTLDSTGCGVFIDSGSLTTSGTSGTNVPADVCGAGFQSPFGTSCTELGCL